MRKVFFGGLSILADARSLTDSSKTEGRQQRPSSTSIHEGTMNLPTPASSVDENSLAAIALAPPTWRARTAAQVYLSMGWVPIPIEVGSKAPGYGWQTRTWDSAAASLDDDFPPAAPRNVGVLLGEASTGLVDLDLDSPSIAVWADVYLPPTLTFGRVGKPRSHRIYQAPVAKCWRFQDPISKAMLLEVRSNGGQTVFPGSVHPSGEVVEWCAGGERALRRRGAVARRAAVRCGRHAGSLLA